MVILAISGSPRKSGNTELLLHEAIRGAESAGATIDHIRLDDLNFSPCTECGACHETGVCVLKDDMQTLYPKLLSMDGIIIAAPVFFMGLPAHAKAFVDRCQPLWAMKYILNKRMTGPSGELRPGAFLSVGGTGFDYMFDGSVNSIKSLFSVLDVKYCEDLLVKRIDEKGSILEDEESLKQAHNLGRHVASSQ
jgi:multimeric flavodoxin WrbA